MKSLVLSAILFTCGFSATMAQNISISVGEEPSGSSGTVFPLEDGELSVSANQMSLGEREFYMPYSWSVSPENRKISFLLKESQVIYQVLDSDGSSYFEKKLEFFNIRDETAKNYQFDDGSSILRDNVANFSFYSPKGEQLFSISNSSQSTEGERESELATDNSGKTIVLYNPVINYGNATGSRASFVTSERELYTFFRDREREISRLDVSSSGTFICIIVKPAAGSGEYSALIFDKFGNKLFDLNTDEELTGLELTADAKFVTLYSSGRMQVYRLNDAERIGSASSRNSIIYAMYDPNEDLIIALGGNINGYSVTNASVTVVHIGQRQIASEVINSNLHALNGDDIRLVKEDHQHYKVLHLDRSIQIRTSF